MPDDAAVELTAMTPPEFDVYMAEMLPGYARDRARADGVPYDEALAFARRQIAEILRDGAEAAGSRPFHVHDRATGARVGALWLLGRGAAWHISDIRIDERVRRRGFGAATLRAIEDLARGSGATSVGLHVFGHNPGARALYERCGYGTVGLNMRKDLDVTGPPRGRSDGGGVASEARAAQIVRARRAEATTSFDDVLAWLGTTDVYVLDQVMRRRLRQPMRVLDAGCGDGRNVELLLRAGCDVHGIDASADAIERARARAAAVAPHIPETNFRVAEIETLGVDDAGGTGTFDAVLCVAALHFARDRTHFEAMVAALGRVLRPGGLLLVRLATSIGAADRFAALGGGRFRLGDGTERFLVDEATLVALTASLSGELADPLKTVDVHGLRAMTTWVVRKRPA